MKHPSPMPWLAAWRRTLASHSPRLVLVLAALLLSSLTASASGSPEIVIRDCASDNGSEPSSGCSSWTNSPDIKVQTSSSYSPTARHTCKAGQDNYVFVTLQNIGSGTLNSGTVYVYWSKLALNQVWSSSWINHVVNGHTIGAVIGSASVTNLGPNATTQVMITWHAADVPDPVTWSESFTHVCLVARFVSSEDPMSHTEGSDMMANTKNNNNNAWKNLDILKGNKRVSHVICGNSSDNPTTYDIHFDEDNGGGTGFYASGGTVTVDLGLGLHSLWVAGGSLGVNVAEYDPNDPSNTRISITGASASLDNLAFGPQEQYTIQFFPNPDPGEGLTGGLFTWNLTQIASGTSDVLGGATITLDLTDAGSGTNDPDFDKRAGSAERTSAEYHLTASPNPTGGSTMIGYALPSDTKVTLGIYDASGTLVRTLSREVEQRKGSYQIEWDGTSSSGVRVAAGSYFFRLQADGRSLEQQVKIVH